jgi:hypothetical protein
MTNMTPEAKPTRILNRFGSDQVDSNKKSPIMDTGILFREPCGKAHEQQVTLLYIKPSNDDSNKSQKTNVPPN